MIRWEGPSAPPKNKINFMGFLISLFKEKHGLPKMVMVDVVFVTSESLGERRQLC